VLKDGYLFWMKSESDRFPLGMLKVIKPSIRIEISDSILEITETKTNTKHYFQSMDGTEDVDDWKKAFRMSKVNKYHKKKASSIFAPINLVSHHSPHCSLVRSFSADRLPLCLWTACAVCCAERR
jgi:hypothetical protein